MADAEHDADYFLEAMEVGLLVFSFPIRTAMVVIFSKKTRRNYKWLNINTILDIAMFLGVFVWFVRYQIVI